MISYAQNLEDVILNRLFRGKKTGFYIDVGACYPVEMSVTKHFYDLGWNGINIEPVPSCYRKLQEERPKDINLNLAVGMKSGYKEIFEIKDYPEYSSMDRRIAEAGAKHTGSSLAAFKVEVKTLKEICEFYCHEAVDFLKIDAEGMEKEVITGADWKKFRPTLLVIEATIPCSGYDPAHPLEHAAWLEWEPLILDAGYLLVYDDTLNRYYLKKEEEQLKLIFDYPANPVRDEYVLYNQVKETEILKAMKQKLQGRCVSLQDKLEDTEKADEALKKQLLFKEGENAVLDKHIKRLTKDLIRVKAECGELYSAQEEHRTKFRKVIEERGELATRLEQVIDEEEQLRQEFSDKILELESCSSDLEKMGNRVLLLEKDLAGQKDLCNRQEAEIGILRHVLMENQFRSDHWIRCFLDRFIPLPGSCAGQFISGTVYKPGEARNKKGFTRKEEKRPGVEATVGKPEYGLDLEDLEDYSCFGMTARHWEAAMKTLDGERNEKGLFFTPNVSSCLLGDPRNPRALTKPWTGIVQEPHTIPDWLSRLPECGGAPWLFEQQAWKQSLPYCRGLLALSEYSAEFLRKRFPGKPVSVLPHPADSQGDKWSPEKFRENQSKKVIQPGWYLRNLHSIYEIPETDIERIVIPFHPDPDAFQQLFAIEHQERKSRGLLFECMMKSASVMEDVTEEELGRMLTENIAFVNLYESNAVDAVVECIARATPLLVNPMPAVVEYLGPEYPFYIWCYDQAAEKADDEKLAMETHEYLKNMEITKRMKPEAFRDCLLDSEVFKSAVGKARG